MLFRSRFEAKTAPPTAAAIVAERDAIGHAVDAMSAALGPRATRLWKQWADYACAALLERYLTVAPDAADLDRAFEELMALYSRGDYYDWDRAAGEVRWMTAFDTTPADVDAFVQVIREELTR